jgi:DNA-binding Xre family transcriptional regulator
MKLLIDRDISKTQLRQEIGIDKILDIRTKKSIWKQAGLKL